MSAAYNERFAAALTAALGEKSSDYPLKQRVEELIKNREVEQVFPGRDKLWLQKELSKWRGKLRADGKKFCGTLQSLQLYCDLTGLRPNEVLLPAESYVSPSKIEFLQEETIYELAENLAGGEQQMEQGCALPVLYAPGEMTAVFLFIYPVRNAGQQAVHMRFAISEPDGYVDFDGSECTGGISTAADSRYYTADLSHPEGIDRLREAYRKIRGEFESVCSTRESPLKDAIHSFYDLMGSWVRNEREDLLFSWYPPQEDTARQARGTESLGDVLSGYGFAAERER